MRSRDGVDQARLAAAQPSAPDAAVSGKDRMWPLVSERTSLYNFPSPWEHYEPGNDPVPVEVRRAHVDYLLIDTVDRAQWDPGRAEALRRLVPEVGATLVFARAGIEVYRLPPDRPGAELSVGRPLKRRPRRAGSGPATRRWPPSG